MNNRNASAEKWINLVTEYNRKMQINRGMVNFYYLICSKPIILENKMSKKGFFFWIKLYFFKALLFPVFYLLKFVVKHGTENQRIWTIKSLRWIFKSSVWNKE